MRHTIARSIERGLNGDGSGSDLARGIAAAVAGAKLHPAGVEAMRRLLYALRFVDFRQLSSCRSPQALQGLAFLASLRDRWIRPLAHVDLRAARNDRDGFHILAGHLLCRFVVSVNFADAWLEGDEWGEKGRRWFLHVGDGCNLRDAPELPFALTRRMAHFALNAPSHLTMLQALRWGEFTGMGVPFDLAGAAAASLLGRPWPNESYCVQIGRFLAAHPDLSTGRVTPIVDFLHARFLEQRGEAGRYNLAAKALATVERDILAWHQELARNASDPNLAWASCGIEGMEPFHKSGGQTWSIVELTNADALRAEGSALRHCVSSYAQWAAKGSCAIFSLRTSDAAGARPQVTIQVNLPDRRIVQARGHANSLPLPKHGRPFAGGSRLKN